MDGRFVVLEAVYSGPASVSQFAADFEQHCDGRVPALFGSIRINSSVPLVRRISVSGAKVIEGNAGIPTAAFTVALSDPASEPVQVSYATTDGTAVAGVDYRAASGILTFAPGQVARSVAVRVLPNTAVDGDRSFNMNLADASGALITFGQGAGTILDDDSGSTLIALYSQPGEFIGQGAYITLSPIDGRFTGVLRGNLATVSFDGSDDWRLDMQARDSLPLVIGSYEGAMEVSSQAAHPPGLALSGGGRGCESSGRFVIHELAATAGVITRLAADFEQHCDNTAPALFGFIRVNSLVPVPVAALSIALNDGLDTARPGQTVTYTIKASNAGPQSVVNAVVNDSVPAGLLAPTWTCVGVEGGTCAASGTGSIHDTVALPVDASVIFSLTGTIDPSASGSLSNTASVSAPPDGPPDPSLSRHTATDTDALVPSCNPCTDGIVDGTFEAGDPWRAWTIQASARFGTPVCNLGECGIDGGTAAPFAGTNWAWFGGTEHSESATLGQWVMLPRSLDLRLRFQLRIGSISAPLTDTLVVKVDGMPLETFAEPAAPEPTYTPREIGLQAFADGRQHELDFVYGHPDPGLASFTVDNVELVVVPLTADLSITQTDGVPAATPGQPLTYTIVATNAGPSPVTGARVTDVVPAALAGVVWSCVAAGGGTCAAAGSGDIDDAVDLPVGATVTYQLHGTLAPSTIGILGNTASVAAPPAVTDPALANNSATDADGVALQADLSITNTDGHAAAHAGQAVIYTIVVSNAGPYPASAATVTDAAPADLTNVTWTCAGADGGTCAASGVGSIIDTPNLPVGASVTYTLHATIDPSAAGTVTNTASVVPPNGVLDPNPGNDSATDTDPLVTLGLHNDTPASAKTVHIGSTSADALGPAPDDQNWFRYPVQSGRSYCVEVDNGKSDTSIRDTMLSVYRDEGATLVASNDDIAGEPGGALLSRACYIATASEDHLANVTAGASGSPGGFRLRVVDTTLFGPWFFSANGFESFILIKNTTGTAHSATVTLSSVAGTMLGSPATVIVPADGSYNLQVSAPGPAGFALSAASGGVTIAHDGPPGSLIVNVTSMSFGSGVSFDTLAAPRKDDR